MGTHRLSLIPLGLLPVSLIGAAAFGVAGLRALAIGLLFPAVIVALALLSGDPGTRRLVLTALAVGVVATAAYDAFRLLFLSLGAMERDPIPGIGAALHLRPHVVFGYLWRYIGNGGGLAVAFFALGCRGARTGLLYGLLVCAGLLLTLLLAPHGETMLFPLNPVTVVMAVGGHAIYGATLGWLSGRQVGVPRLALA